MERDASASRKCTAAICGGIVSSDPDLFAGLDRIDAGACRCAHSPLSRRSFAPDAALEKLSRHRGNRNLLQAFFVSLSAHCVILVRSTPARPTERLRYIRRAKMRRADRLSLRKKMRGRQR